MNNLKALNNEIFMKIITNMAITVKGVCNIYRTVKEIKDVKSCSRLYPRINSIRNIS